MRRKVKSVFVPAVLVLAVLALPVAGTSCRARTYTNGSYQAVSQADDHGYTWAKVVIENDKLTAVELREFTEFGVEKDFATYPWAPAKTANEIMPGRFVQAGSWDVDVVAEATASSEKYKQAVSFALEKARRKPTMTTAFFQGTFMGVSAADSFGHGVAWVTIQNDELAGVLLEEVVLNDEGEYEFKDWEDYDYRQVVDARDEMTARLKAASPATVAAVDAVAEATSSSNKWKEAVQNALAGAKFK